MADPIKPETVSSKPQGRGISYPFIGLEDAIQKARAFYAEERKSAVPVVAAMRHFGYGDNSGGGRQTVSALIQFGLLEDQGIKENRQVKLTERALVILLDQPDSPARLVALRESARFPKLYSELLARWPEGLPSDHTISFHLQKDKDFNPKTLESFIRDFRGSLAFAKIVGDDTIASIKPLATAPAGSPPPNLIKVGDYVQWESSGVIQFADPRQVTGLSEDGVYAFVAGTSSGVPVKELSQMQQPQTAPAMPPAAASSLLPPLVKLTAGSRQDTFSLDEGNVVLQWPDKMSPDSFADFEAWMQLQLRKIKRGIN